MLKTNVIINKVSINSYDYNVDLENKYVKINSRIVNLPYKLKGKLKITRKNKNTIIQLANGIKINWDFDLDLFVTAPKFFKNKLCGLCGNFDSKSSNDLNTRENILVEDPSIFAQSWSAGEEICYNSRSLENQDCNTRRSER